MSDTDNLGEYFELAMDIDNHLSFDALDYWEEDGVQVSIMVISSSDGQREERLRVVKNGNQYSVGQVIDFDTEEDGSITYDLRNVHIFMQEYQVCSSFPVEDNQQMMGPVSYVAALRIPKLIKAKLFGNEELRLQIIEDIECFCGGEDKDLSDHRVSNPQDGNVVYPKFR